MTVYDDSRGTVVNDTFTTAKTSELNHKEITLA